MRDLFKLKRFLTLDAAASHLSVVMDDDVTVADVLQLGLLGHLQISVDLVNHAPAMRGKFIPIEEATFQTVPSLDGEGTVILWDGLQIRPGEVLVLSPNVVTIEGLWDLLMIGNERLDVEHSYQYLTGGPEVTLINTDGTFVSRPDGTVCQIQEYPASKPSPDPSNIPVTRANSNKELIEAVIARRGVPYPAGALPPGSVLVVRTSALLQLEAAIAQPEPATERPIETRERNTLLGIIGALADMPRVNIKKPSAAARKIETKTIQMEARISARAIENHLHRVLEALEIKAEPEINAEE